MKLLRAAQTDRTIVDRTVPMSDVDSEIHVCYKPREIAGWPALKSVSVLPGSLPSKRGHAYVRRRLIKAPIVS